MLWNIHFYIFSFRRLLPHSVLKKCPTLEENIHKKPYKKKYFASKNVSLPCITNLQSHLDEAAYWESLKLNKTLDSIQFGSNISQTNHVKSLSLALSQSKLYYKRSNLSENFLIANIFKWYKHWPETSQVVDCIKYAKLTTILFNLNKKIMLRWEEKFKTGKIDNKFNQ